MFIHHKGYSPYLQLPKQIGTEILIKTGTKQAEMALDDSTGQQVKGVIINGRWMKTETFEKHFHSHCRHSKSEGNGEKLGTVSKKTKKVACL